MSTKYSKPPAPSKPADYADFLASLTERDKELLELGEQWLGSSFFIQWTHLYGEWKAKAGSGK